MTGRSSTTTGIMLMVAAMAIMPMADGIAKWLVPVYGPVEVTWLRYAAQVAILLPIVMAGGVTGQRGWRALRLANPVAQTARGVCLIMSVLFYLESLKTLAIPNAIATVFLFPMLVAAVSPLILGERIGPRRIAAIAAGFLGALMVIQPGTDVFEVGSLYAIATASVYTGYVVLTRKYAESGSPSAMLLVPSIVGLVIVSAAAPAAWTTPTPAGLALGAAAGGISALGHYLVINAYKRAEAAIVAPFTYTQIIASTAVSYAVWRELPNALGAAGIAVIVASGVFISFRESRTRDGSRDIRRKP